MAKPSKNRERAERIEALRRESQRAERRRTLIVVLICGVLALAIVGATGWKLWNDQQRADEVAGTDLADIGVSADAAGCGDITTGPAKDQGVHLDGQPIDYTEYGAVPPAFGAHWSETAEFDRKFYTEADRPEVERLVHNLEHGYTVLWYDESIADDDDAMQTIQDLAEKFEVGDAADIGQDLETYNSGKFIAAPWTADDGGEFPDGAHVMLAHWAYEGDAFDQGEVTGEGQGTGVWQSCDQPSGEAVEAFMAEYPSSNSPEPNGG